MKKISGFELRKHYIKKDYGWLPIAIIIFCVILVLILSYFFLPLPGISVKDVSGLLVIHFIDVGQGDCTLITFPDGSSVMIDAGTNDSEQYLKAYLDAYRIKKIDYLILTHPHEDHIGGADMVIENYNVKRLIMPDITTETSTFERLIDAVEVSDTFLEVAASGDSFEVDDCVFDVLSPIIINGDDLNECSIVIKLTYLGYSAMFTGDAGESTERLLLGTFSDKLLDCELLKVGHHGSYTSSCTDFLNAVTPDYAVISCAKGNDYGHPHGVTLDRLDRCGANILRTDRSGTLLFIADNKGIRPYS